jgi:hypothetical protein
MNPMKRRVIIESPYRGTTPEETARNIAYAKRCVLDSLSRNESPIASHLLFPQDGILLDADPEQRKLGIDAGHAWIPVCHFVALYTDHGISPGMEAGLAVAKEFGIAVERRTIGP